MFWLYLGKWGIWFNQGLDIAKREHQLAFEVTQKDRGFLPQTS